MESRRIWVDPSLCTECKLCQLACSSAKGQGFSPRKALLRVETESEGLLARPVVCLQCQNPFCAKVCPVLAIGRRDDGVVVIDEDLCTGCGECQRHCIQGVIVTDQDKNLARKCDLCKRCVEDCPTGALSLVLMGGDETK